MDDRRYVEVRLDRQALGFRERSYLDARTGYDAATPLIPANAGTQIVKRRRDQGRH